MWQKFKDALKTEVAKIIAAGLVGAVVVWASGLVGIVSGSFLDTVRDAVKDTVKAHPQLVRPAFRCGVFEVAGAKIIPWAVIGEREGDTKLHRVIRVLFKPAFDNPDRLAPRVFAAWSKIDQTNEHDAFDAEAVHALYVDNVDLSGFDLHVLGKKDHVHDSAVTWFALGVGTHEEPYNASCTPESGNAR